MAEGLEERARQLAQRFHETYERLAPQFGYETRRESAKPWAEVPEQNRNLMIAVCKEVGEQVRRETMEQTAKRCAKIAWEAETHHDAVETIRREFGLKESEYQNHAS